MMHLKTPAKSQQTSLLDTFRYVASQHHCGAGLWVLVAVFLFLSLLSSVNFSLRPKVFPAGEVASTDITSDRELLVENVQATNARREQLLRLQPMVYDLNPRAYADFHDKIINLFREINEVDPDKKYAVVSQLMDTLTPDVAESVMLQVSRPEVQEFILQDVFPQLRAALQEGIVGDVRSAQVGSRGVIIRNVDTKTETLRPEVTTLPDMHTLLLQITARLRKNAQVTPQAQRAITILLSALAPATLQFNGEATRERAAAIGAEVEPVYYHLQKGEVVVRKGERVTAEQQMKLQAIDDSAGQRVQWKKLLGTFGFSLLLGIGLFIAPSGRKGSPLYRKDCYLIALVLGIFSMSAKVIYLLGQSGGDVGIISALPFAFPVAGAVGVVAMVFAARRYCTMGLLLSLFATLMFKAGVALFLFYFLGGMLATWLVTRAQSRQEVVWIIVPLTFGQVLIWLAACLLETPNTMLLPAQLVAVVANSVITLLTLFALSPILELLLGYTTRFRLMELMSLEQPLMQEIMMTMPGTYHHSLVVANMVEAGAKAIDANSLLCKVAALYHDAGKIMHPEYFIENQYGGPNKHDKLAPSMSALVLQAHVKKGTELAEQHNLGQEIIDIIRQHHGTRSMQYFYKKACDLGENPSESDYSYPGPKPQTKEAAILMLADSVEASSRTLSDPTPQRIKTHINTIMKGIFSEGQLDESELTFKDLHKLSETFLRILTGIFHQRIAYPSDTRKDAPQSAPTTGQGVHTAGTSTTSVGGTPPRATGSTRNGAAPSAPGRPPAVPAPVPSADMHHGLLPRMAMPPQNGGRK